MMLELCHDLWRKAVFLVGKIRKLDAFPWITWANEEHQVGYDEITEALPLIQYGDIGLHRYAGYLDNVAISGFMIHAWVHTEDGFQGKIVEAVSEGVLHRSPFYGMYADYTMILRPRNVTEKDRKGACKKAKQIVRAKYDVDFEFDIERELKYYQGQNRDAARGHLKKGSRWMKKYEPAFTCTEVAAYAWWHKRDDLGIHRTKHWGKSVVLGDTFVNPGWDIVWASRAVTPETARALGMPAQGVEMIAEYRKQHP